MKTFFPFLLLTLYYFLNAGCASIVSKSNYPVTVATEPSGAELTISNKKNEVIFSGRTPTVFILKAGDGFFSKASYLIKVNKKGFPERIVPVNFRINAWYFGNILIGGIVGMLIVDPITGAMWKIQNDDFFIKLAGDNDAAQIKNPSSLNIITLDKVPENLRSKMIKIK